MRKANLILGLAVVLAVLTGLALHQVHEVSAQGDSPVGVVVAYTPGVSITIVDPNGNQIEYMLDSTVRIESPDGKDAIQIGSIVTIIAPASVDKGKQKAVGIVVHPEKELLPSETPRVKNTPLPTDVPVTKTPKVSETPTLVDDLSATPTTTLTETPIASESATKDKTDVKANPFIEWLRSLFRQVLNQQ